MTTENIIKPPAQSEPRSPALALAPSSPSEFKVKAVSWDVGHYYDDRSICVNLRVDGVQYHRHDHGLSFLPRWWRIGRAICQLEKEAGLPAYRAALKAHVGV